MKTFTLGALLALASLSLAQLEGLPLCAQNCATTFLQNGIGNCGRDATCICSDKDFLSSISCCLIGACGPADQQKAIDYAQQICQANQVSVPNTVACTSTSAAAGAGAAASSTGTSSSTVTQSSSDTKSTPASTHASTSPSASGSGSGTPAQTSAPSSSKSTAAAGPRQTAAPVMGALGFLAAAALL